MAKSSKGDTGKSSHERLMRPRLALDLLFQKKFTDWLLIEIELRELHVKPLEYTSMI